MVLLGNLRAGEVEVMVYHLQCVMTQYFTEREDIPTNKQVVDGKGMSAKVGM